MAISVDTVYQTVLALANKEQRGYITPQEFNLFASQAQMEIFDQYFYDLNQFKRLPGSKSLADIPALIEEKLSSFYQTENLTNNTPEDSTIYGEANPLFWNYTLPPNFHTIDKVYAEGSVNTLSGRWDVEIVSKSRAIECALSGPLVRPTHQNPIGYVDLYQDSLVNKKLHISPVNISRLVCTYLKKPNHPKWTYVLISDKAMWNPMATDRQDFELHPSEQSMLVMKILKLAGISMTNQGVAQAGIVEEQRSIQQEKA